MEVKQLLLVIHFHLDYLEVLEEVQEMKMANHHILRVQEIHHQ